MRSVPFKFGTDIRHLRYTFGSVSDLNALVPGGFMSIFQRDADTQVAHLLLWAGLCHENVSYEDVGYYLISSNAIRDDAVLLDIWKKVTVALTNDEWIAVEERKAGDDSQPGKTFDEMIGDMERIAASDFNMTPSELYGLTPREFNLLQESYGLRDNLRVGIVCATNANIHCKHDGKGFEPSDFIRCQKPRGQTPQEQAAILGGMFS